MTESELKEQEKKELDLLTNRGENIEIDTLFCKLFGKKTRKFQIKGMYAGTNDLLSRYYASLEYDQEQLKVNSMAEVKRMMQKHSFTLCKIVATAIINNWFFLWLRVPFAWYLKGRITATHFLKVTEILNTQSNFLPFASSIVSMSSMTTTTPKTIEEGTKA